MANARTIKSPGIFAADALTTIPPSPAEGVSYRNAATGVDNIADGWPFAERVKSEEFNEIMYRLTALVDAMDRGSILPWSSSVVYDNPYGAIVFGSNSELYMRNAVTINGPGTPAGVRDPVTEPGHWFSFNQIYNPPQPGASTTVVGQTRYATDAETQAGLLNTAAVTPAGLATLTSTTTRAGLIRSSTSAETVAGALGSVAVTPASLATLTATTTRRGLTRYASASDALNDAVGDAALTPTSLAARVATTALAGIVRMANNSELMNGANYVAMTPADFGARTATESRVGTTRLATNAEAANGGVNYAAVPPSALQAELAKFLPNCQGNDSSKRGALFPIVTGGAVVVPPGGVWFVFKMGYNLTGDLARVHLGYTAGGTVVDGGGTGMNYGWMLRISD